MRLSERRSELAPLLGTTDQALYQRQKQLYNVPVLRAAGMVGHRGPDAGPEASSVTVAILILAAMAGESRTTIGQRTGRLWQAPCMTPPGHALDQYTTLGPLLTLLLERADIRSQLDYLEVNHAIPDFLVMFKDGSRLFYAPYSSSTEWKRRTDAVPPLSRKSTLWAATLDKVAALIAADEAAEKNAQ
jgi:hypothetical protein